MIEHSIPTTRTARYFTSGDTGADEAWLLVHGYGELAADLLANFEHLEDCFFVAPEGLSRFYMDRHRRVGASWMTRENRLNEIRDYLEFLHRVYEDSLSHRRIALNALGFSQGVHTVCRWASRGPQLQRLVLWGSGVPEDLPQDEFATAMKGCRVIVVAGSDDKYFSPADADREWKNLTSIGVDVEVVHYDGGHSIDGRILDRVLNG
ncbi:MAG: alpha/beta hydrolase [Rhodothermia bacterium]|nr:alpha/beta hydrolase [Rhodothermia bacterium]